VSNKTQTPSLMVAILFSLDNTCEWPLLLHETSLMVVAIYHEFQFGSRVLEFSFGHLP